MDRVKSTQRLSNELSTDFSMKAHFGRSLESIKDKLTAAGYSTGLVDVCSCSECKAVGHTRLSQCATGVPSDSHQCLSKIAIAVFGFIWVLSWLDIDDIIRPSSNGLLNLCSPNFDPPRKTRSEQFEEGAFVRVIRLLTGFSVEVFRNPSAVVLHGLCIYRPALKDPNTGVESQLRMRVVPGQIERNGKIYDQLNERSNPRLAHGGTEIVDIELTTGVLRMLGARPLLQVAVEETLESASLNTKLVVVPGSNTPIHWSSLFRPSVGSCDDRVSYKNMCSFCTANELFTYINNSLKQIQCQGYHGSTPKNDLWSIYQCDDESWSGRCSVADMPWWTMYQRVDNQELPSLPQSSEWVIAVSETFNTTQIILGSAPLLYCLLAGFVILGLSPCLLKSDDCMICMELLKRYTEKRNIWIHYFSKAGQVKKLELLPQVQLGRTRKRNS